jgi:polysaccharide biosynthesis protein PslH
MASDGTLGGPKILFVTSHWPLAPAYGAQQRVLNLARLLGRFGNVSFLIVSPEIEDEETARKSRREFTVCKVVRPLEVGPRKPFIPLRERLRHEFDPTYMATDPYVVSESDRQESQVLFQHNDLVWIHTLRAANWFRIYRWPNSVLDLDDLQSQTCRSAAQSSGNPATCLMDFRRAWIWRRRERVLRDRFDVLTVCSEDDRQYLGMEERVHVIPNGSNPVVDCPRVSTHPPRIGFIGNCGFMPNKEGVKWFIRHVWPVIQRQLPGVQLRLVGRESDGYLSKLGRNVVGLGWLQDPGDEIATWSAMVVPIKVGGGTRVKFAEGFARKCPIVATTIGAFGYNVEEGREFLLANRTDDFAAACLRLLHDPRLGQRLSESAHQRFLERWTWESSEGTIGTVVQECLARAKAAKSPQAPEQALVSHR